MNYHRLSTGLAVIAVLGIIACSGSDTPVPGQGSPAKTFEFAAGGHSDRATPADLDESWSGVPVPEELERFCTSMPCDFFTTEKWDGVRSGEELMRATTPASECPGAGEAYAEAGYNVGGFHGPCPTPEQLADITPLTEHERYERSEIGGELADSGEE